ncbi:MAG: ribonuclease R [Oscillospiraceae bacterium]|nr:ribonuclease R [Oscillospiraceae bacterium]
MARHNRKHIRKKQLSAQTVSRHPADPQITEQYIRKIKVALRSARMHRMKPQEMEAKCRAMRSPASYLAAVEQLRREGFLREVRGRFVLCEGENTFPASVVRLSAGFGFIRDEAGRDYFVPGKHFQGAMPGDTVLAIAKPAPQGGSPEAEILSILEKQPEVRLTGTIVPTEEGLCLLPDSMNLTLHIQYRESAPYQIGDKVLCVLTERGTRHAEHRVRVLMSFGSSDSAEHCMQARIAEFGITPEFPEEVLHEAGKLADTGITAFDLDGRRDLREEVIFTIDGAHSKDLDDAVSVSRNPDGSYALGVHIADVSHYVRAGSPLDKEALERGTSIYYADKVIPMLPPALSNGICSLNPGEDRLAFSAFLHVSEDGELLDSEFAKSVIRSQVRGVYSECNAILDGSASPEIAEKYAPVADALHLLDELTQKLDAQRIRRGAPSLETTESVLLLDENGVCTGLAPVQRGRSECIIESCMLCANEAAARLARKSEIPLVYRVHEEPSPERIGTLKEMLEKLGAQVPDFAEASPRDIQEILDNAREEDYFPVVNMLTLRSMAKARYSEEPLGHFGLALRDYAHFTSPIRRYPDLCVHRILTDLLSGADKGWMQKRYAKFAQQAARQSSDRELRAVSVEREADACYAAEYMQAHVGETFRGVISGVTDHGIYVTLENNAEGLLHIHDMPEGTYTAEEGWYLKNEDTGMVYRLGAPLTVICAAANVSAGHIDLALCACSRGADASIGVLSS